MRDPRLIGGFFLWAGALLGAVLYIGAQVAGEWGGVGGSAAIGAVVGLLIAAGLRPPRR